MNPIGREREFGFLKGIFARCAAGKNELALLSGSYGCGMVELLDACSAYAADQGALVLATTASPADRERPLSVADRLLRNAARPLAEHGGLMSSRKQSPRPRRLPGADLVALGNAGPVLIRVDDAQHMDTASLDLLASVLSDPGTSRVFVLLGAGLDTEASLRLFLEKHRRLRVWHTTLGPLASRDVACLLKDVAGTEPPPSVLSAWHSASGGNPLVLRALVEDCWAGQPGEDRGWRPPPVAGDPYRKAVADVLDGCGESVRDTARVLAFLNDWRPPEPARPFSEWEADCGGWALQRLLDVTPETVLRSLRALRATGLVSGWDFRDQAIPTAVLAGLAVPERVDLQLRATALLTRALLKSEKADRPTVVDHKLPEEWRPDWRTIDSLLGSVFRAFRGSRAATGPADTRRGAGAHGQNNKPLTRAERRVAELVALGHTNREISDELYITASTVGQHLTQIYRKLGARTRAELVAYLAAAAGTG